MIIICWMCQIYIHTIHCENTKNMTETYALVWSNVIYLLPSALLLYKGGTKWIWEAVSMLLLAVASTQHHLCNTPDIHVCGDASPAALYHTDLVYAFSQMGMTLAPFLKQDRNRYAFVTLNAIAAMLLVSYSESTALPLLGAINLLVLVYTHYNQTLGMLHLLTVMFGVAGLICYVHGWRFERDDPMYQLYHSLWHIGTGAAASCLVATLPAPLAKPSPTPCETLAKL